MRLHCVQHVPFEVPGAIASWARQRGHVLSGTLLGAGGTLPTIDDFDWLVVMGGPMNVYEEQAHPWLAGEKRLIREAVDAGRTVLGVCLGAQLVADVLGARVVRNAQREIGWFPVTLTASGLSSSAFGQLPETFMALHWHGDTFAIPDGAVHVAASAACANQAFQFGDRVFGVQFHLECTAGEIADLVRECGDDLAPGEWVQTAEELTSRTDLVAAAHERLYALLDGSAAAAGGPPAASGAASGDRGPLT